MRKTLAFYILFSAIALVFLSAGSVRAESSGTQNMYRLYNTHSGEHFYTASAPERNHLREAGWKYEGIGWVAPSKSDTPVYRLYNANAGDHHYTMSKAEKDMLIEAGWSYEGIGWYSDDARSIPLYRQYNPNAITGSHNYTTSIGENNTLVSLGWRGEGVGWYACGESDLFPAESCILYFDDSSDGRHSRTQVYSWQTVYAHFQINGGDPDGFDTYYCIWSFSDESAPYINEPIKVHYGQPYYFLVRYEEDGWYPAVNATASIYNSQDKLVAQQTLLWGSEE